MDLSIAFIMYFVHGMYMVGPLIGLLLVFILVLGQVVGKIEQWTRFDAVYWSLISAMTVGYGDIRPVKNISKSLSLVIAFTGLVLTGITVAVAIQAGSKAFLQYADYDESVKEYIDEEVNLLNKRMKKYKDEFEE
jgi:voltage-gated potassium channel